MYSVFLVEDEIVIREGIKNLIEWNEYGFTFAGEATDGELAWPLIQKQKPDIVITDIKMPFMDGLTLSRLIKEKLPKTTIMILSGYDDFSYAKEAITSGVSQYLLKPLSKNQLVEVLCEVKKQKDKEEAQNRYLAQFNCEMQEYLTSSRRGFFDALVSGKLTVSELLLRAEKQGLNLAAESYNIVLFLLEENLLQNEYSAQLADVQEELSTCFPENKNLIMFSIGVDIMAFLVMTDKDTIDNKTVDCVNSITEICQPIPRTIKWSVVIGKPVHRLSAVADCYRAARKEMFHRSSGRKSNFYHVGDSAAEEGISSVVDFDPNDMDAAKMDQRIVEKFLMNGLSEDLPGFVTDYFNSVGSKSVQSLMFRQYVVLNIQFTVNAFLEKLGSSKETVGTVSKTAIPLQSAVCSLEESEQYVQDLLSRALTLRDTAVNSRYRSMLKKALAYMNENYASPSISLDAVAKIANVSATHFSAVFSQQIGKTFIEYLTELRMEKAKEQLRCTDCSSGEIALQVGYNDPHYFSFLFKKVNGCSPRDYRLGRKLT